eukprot:Clim_evm43s199 gene=Clim_evmTU43s199
MLAARVLRAAHRSVPLFASTTGRIGRAYTTGKGPTVVPALQVHEEVQEALNEMKPVVALESTIIAHGMPYPKNVETAEEVAKVIRRNGAIPATIAVMDGKLKVGLESEAVERLGKAGRSVRKISRRDLAYAISHDEMGATTVSATMIAANLAGIEVFVTGGIGGVHRDVESTLDISADITELGRTPVSVVCSGAKSFLDIERTLELLETQGVAVGTFGNTFDFPAFFTPSSGYKSPFMFETFEDAASTIMAARDLGLRNGTLIAVPVPDDAAPQAMIVEESIQKALQEAHEGGVKGKDITPYVLARVQELTEGKSLVANIALVLNNARVGAGVATALTKLRKQTCKVAPPGTTEEDEISGYGVSSNHSDPELDIPLDRQGAGTGALPTAGTEATPIEDDVEITEEAKTLADKLAGRPFVIGGAVIDYTCAPKPGQPLISGTSNPGQIHKSFGGVARNVAEVLARLGRQPVLVTAVGDDKSAEDLIANLNECGVSTDGLVQLKNATTAQHCGVYTSHGELVVAIADMDILTEMSPNILSRFTAALRKAPLVSFDSNLGNDAMAYVAKVCHNANVPIWFEPTSSVKCNKPIELKILDKLTYISPNMDELKTMEAAVIDHYLGGQERSYGLWMEQNFPHLYTCHEQMQGAMTLIQYVPNVIVTMGQHGVLVVSKHGDDEIAASHLDALELDPSQPLNVSGAGDSMVGATICGLLDGHPLKQSLMYGLQAAKESLLSPHAVSPKLSGENYTPKSFFKDFHNFM